MLWVKLGTQVIDHPRFMELSATARDLWVWGMLYAGKHETDGDLPLSAVLASAWGAGPKGNAKLASTLVLLGLWRRTDKGFAVCRWSEQGNETKESIEAKRKAGRERKAKSDARRNGVTHDVTHAVSNAKGSTSTSLSVSGSLPDLIASPVRERVVEPIGSSDVAPAWFVTALDVVAMNTGVALPAGDAWLRYGGHRAGKGIDPSQPDAQYWLATVMVPEAREALRRAARDTARDASFRAERAALQPKAPVAQDSRKAFAERDRWAAEVGAPDPEAQARLNKLLGKVGT